MTICDDPDLSATKQERELASLQNKEHGRTEQFVRHHAGWMLAVANRVLRDRSHAEDAVQNAFAAVFKNLDSFNQKSSLKTWMHRIVVNEALMLLRKQSSTCEDSIDPFQSIFDENGCRIEEDWTTFRTPETILQQAQSSAQVIELIGRLPESYRVILVLRDIEELSTTEVADMLETSEANVRVKLHRARSALKKLLEPLIRGGAL
ncbi:RNA polymerase sigma factor [Pelagibius sp. Alg239-R121]|uniref:RNA polymerase sigma factor n=1 Tax=Pelagibius sp. Alg239-R121 TaxID=2993448 RepID=UPI0024A66EEA|nr:sigma-70 family RNA polymerase sigma factor [Pelagibius sp. Alg239-R121]